MLPSQQCRIGEPITFRGYAYDYDKAIAGLEFSLDSGRTWTRYPTDGATSDRLVEWTFSYAPPEAGDYTLFVRSVGEDGTPSPMPDSIRFSAS